MSNTSTLLLKLKGPLQSWGLYSKNNLRDTERHPTKSAIVGLLGACLGVQRDDHVRIQELSGLSISVIVAKPGVIIRDFHTVGGGYSGNMTRMGVPKANRGTPSTVVTNRKYLCDALFFVMVSGDPTVVDACSKAVKDPVYVPFLGRRSCTPTEPLYVGQYSSEKTAREALTTAVKESAPSEDIETVNIIRDAEDPTETDSVVPDIPLDFDKRTFRTRRIVQYSEPLGKTEAY